MPTEIELKIEPPKKLSFNFRELWQYRELFYFFTWRDVKVRYKQTVLGVLWVVLQPVLMVTVLSFAFQKIANANAIPIPYPIFTFSGLIFWNAFSASLNNAGNSMVTHANIIKKIYFPRLVIPISAILVSLVDMAIALVLFFLVLIFWPFEHKFTVDWLLMLPLTFVSIVIMLIGTVGLSCWLSALNVKYRDFRYIVPFALQLMLFISPVIYRYDVDNPSFIHWLLALNPMYAVIEIFRYPLLHDVNLQLLLVSTVSSFLFLVVGLYYFRSTEHYFADLA